jgi:hypothetical protein
MGDGLQLFGVPVQALLGLHLDLAHSFSRDAPAVADLLEGARRVLLEPVVDDLPTQLPDALANLVERTADLPITSAERQVSSGPRPSSSMRSR